VPTAVGARVATVRIVSNDADEPNTDVALTCNGTQGSLSISSPGTPIAFPATDVGASSAEVMVTLRNTGTAAVTVNSQASVAGTGFARTTNLSQTPPFVLAPNATATVGITFTPTADGSHSGTLGVSYDATSLSVGLNGNGRAALVGVSPSTIPLGDVLVGTPSNSSFSVQNTGSAALAIASISHTGSADIALVGAPPTTVAASSTATVNVRCNPSATGLRSATFTVDTDADNAPQDPTVTVTCTGVRPEISVAPPSVAFGNVAPGNGLSMDVVVSNANNPTTSTLTVLAPVVSGTDAAMFVVTPPGAFTLVPGASRTLSVRFTPTGFGAKVATLSISSDDPGGPIAVPLSGTGFDNEITVVQPAGTTIAFGDVKVGESSTATTVRLQNDGNADLTISGVLSTGTNAAEYVVAGPATPAVIAGGSFTDWTVECSPSSVGAKVASLQINSDDADEAAKTFALTCNGTQALLVMTSPATEPVTFQSTRVGEVSAERTIILQNQGTAPLDIVAEARTTPNVFEVSQGVGVTPRTIAAGDSMTLKLQFRPTGDGIVSGNLTVDWDTTSLIVDLRGPGTVATETITPDVDGTGNVDVGAVCEGGSRDQDFEVRSSGTASFTVSAIDVTGTGFTIASPTPPLPWVLGPNQSEVFTLTVAPTGTDEITGTITITSDIPGAPTRTIPVVATGIASGIGVAPATGIDFPNTDPGTQSAASAVTITNCSGAPMDVSAAEIAGTDGGDFLLASGPDAPLTIANMDAAQWTIQFQPAEAGSSNATFHVVHDQAGSPLDVPLTGTSGSGGTDAGPQPDAQPDAAGAGPDGGNALDQSSYYACSAGQGGPTSGLLLLGALAFVLKRRRR
jgi:MYXO-CTERM domain-containing protein